MGATHFSIDINVYFMRDYYKHDIWAHTAFMGRYWGKKEDKYKRNEIVNIHVMLTPLHTHTLSETHTHSSPFTGLTFEKHSLFHFPPFSSRM